MKLDRGKKMGVVGVVLILSIIFTWWLIRGNELVLPKNIYESEDLMNEFMPQYMKHYKVPGVSITSIKNGKVDWTENFGVMNKKTNKKVDDDTIFEAGSISKAVTAWGVMHLVENGQINLDDPVNKYMKRYQLTSSDFDSNKVTIRNLLSHSGGISVSSYPGYSPEEKLPSLEQSINGELKSRTRVTLVKEPNTCELYSGGGYTLLQLMIEDVTGMDFSTYMEQEILKPLGMDNSSFEIKLEFISNYATGYGHLGQEMPQYTFTEKAPAGLYTTTKDLAKFMAAGLNSSDGEIAGRGVLKPETLELMFENETKNFTLGYMGETLDSGERLIIQKGANRGWRAMVLMLPGTGDGIVYMGNSDSGDNLIRNCTAKWVEINTGSIPRYYKGLMRPRAILLIVSILSGISLIIYTARCIVRLVYKDNELIIRKGRKSFLGIITKMVLPLIFCITWWIILYGPIFDGGWPGATKLPAGLPKLTLIVTIWCIVIPGFYICDMIATKKINQ